MLVVKEYPLNAGENDLIVPPSLLITSALFIAGHGLRLFGTAEAGEGSSVRTKVIVAGSHQPIPPYAVHLQSVLDGAMALHVFTVGG